jgi:hypothetical protein
LAIKKPQLNHLKKTTENVFIFLFLFFLKIIQTFLFEQIFYEQIRQTIIYFKKIVRYALN